MKKPITIGVITAILVTSAVDFSAIREQPKPQIRLKLLLNFNTANIMFHLCLI